MNQHITIADSHSDFRILGRHVGSLLGPEYDIRVLSTGKIYRIGDFTYQRLKKHHAEIDTEGWLEIDEDGEPVEEEPTINHTAAMRRSGAFGE